MRNSLWNKEYEHKNNGQDANSHEKSRRLHSWFHENAIDRVNVVGEEVPIACQSLT